MKRQAKKVRPARAGRVSDEDKLRSLPGGRVKAGGIELWFRTHPKAADLVDTWLRMRANGESSWDAPDVMAELRSSHEMPDFGTSGFRVWVERTRGAAYRAARGR